MSEVISHEACEQCGGVAVSFFNYKTYEESIHCQECGYSEEAHLSKDPSSGQYELQTSQLPGYGAYCLQRLNGAGSVGSFSGGEGPAAMVRDLVTEELDMTRTYITQWDPNTQSVKYLLGNASMVPQ